MDSGADVLTLGDYPRNVTYNPLNCPRNVTITGLNCYICIMIQRIITEELKVWKDKEQRKPLVLRGARQVGKTTAVNLFAQEYKQYIYLNLEEGQDAALFLQYRSIDTLVQAIFYGRRLIPFFRKMHKTCPITV